MEKVNEESLLNLCDEIIAYFNVDDVEYKSSSRPKPRKISFIKKLASQWTSDGVMVTEGYNNDLEKVLTYLDKKPFSNKASKNISIACSNASKMIGRYLAIMKFFDMDDMIARKYVNNTKNIEHDLEEVIIKVSEEHEEKS
ncbi:MAG: hypothetical protein WBA74_06590 [Cyclobacteriaceae bacterium]